MAEEPKASKSGRWQFSLRTLLVAVAFVAVGCAALVKPSFLWASFLWTSTTAVLAFAVLMVIYRSGASRAFWVGFVLIGWGHMILALGPWLDDYTGEFIFTRHLLDQLGHALGHEVENLGTIPGIWHNMPYAVSGTSYNYLTYLVAGQSWLTLILAYLGGLLARYFYSTREDES